MASSSTASSNTKASRLSTTLNKAFKFSSKDRDGKPPPLPPKDQYYLQNKSLASLSPPDSLPNSPLSPPYQYTRRPSPDSNPNRSTMSLVSSSAASAKSFSPGDSMSPATLQQAQKKGKAFFRFPKRVAKTPSTPSPAVGDDVPPPPTEDEGISWPQNFQHNIHVDEGYIGLPPSWATSLADAGFTEDEIAAIHSRRAAGTLSPGSQYLYTDRPQSPANSPNNPHANPTGSPVLTRPSPRTTSLPRPSSDASLRGVILQRNPPPIPIPAISRTSNASPTHTPILSNNLPSVGSRIPPVSRQQLEDHTSLIHHGSSSSLSLSLDSHHSNGHSNVIPEKNGALAEVDGAVPSTPPRRIYHVANGSPVGLNSPPPAYSHSHISNIGYQFADKKDNSRIASSETTPRSYSNSPAEVATTFADGSQNSHQRRDSTGSVHSSSASRESSPPRTALSKRLTALPPRLSLHKDSYSTDLSSWSEALISALPSELSQSSQGSSEPTPGSSKLAAHQPSSSTFSSTFWGAVSPTNGFSSPDSVSLGAGWELGVGDERTQPSSQTRAEQGQKQIRGPPPTRPVPSIVLRDARPADEDDAEEAKGTLPESASGRVGPSSSSPATRFSSSPQWDEQTLSGGSPLWGDLRMSKDGDPNRYSAALTESHSPTLPISPSGERSVTDIIGGSGGGRIVEGGRLSAYRVRDQKEDEDEDGGLLSVAGGRERDSNRDSSQSNTSTLSTVTITGLTAPTIVRNASIARRTGAYVIDKSGAAAGLVARAPDRGDAAAVSASPVSAAAPRSSTAAPSTHEPKQPPSPLSSSFGSEEGSGSGSASSSSLSQDHQTPSTEAGTESYYVPSPDPSKMTFSPSPHHQLLVSTTDTFGGIHKNENLPEEGDVDEDDENSDPTPSPSAHRPTITIGDNLPELSPPTAISPGTAPVTPSQRYRGWLSEVVEPLEEFIDDTIDPRDYYLDLQEIAEGDSGSVFAARLAQINLDRLRLPPLIKATDNEDLAQGRQTFVAIKSVAILPSGSPKLVDLQRELSLMKNIWHENILSMDALYVDLVEDSLWIRMELMERSLADVLGLVDEGLTLHDRVFARFTSDALQALEHLQQHNIAHRDVRSDNLLLNRHGVLKLADFSNAVQVTRKSPMRSDSAGVVYWQAPEMRSPPYNALKVDVWSLGATVWEMAQAAPPFADTQQIADRWPPLQKPKLYSPAFHEFLRQCSEPAASRPDPNELNKSPFIKNACGRQVIIQLLSQCMAIEQTLQGGDDTQGPHSD